MPRPPEPPFLKAIISAFHGAGGEAFADLALEEEVDGEGRQHHNDEGGEEGEEVGLRETGRAAALAVGLRL